MFCIILIKGQEIWDTNENIFVIEFTLDSKFKTPEK